MLTCHQPTSTLPLSDLAEPARSLARDLLAARLIDEAPLGHLLHERRDTLSEFAQPGRFAQLLQRHNLITGYQRERILAGDWRRLLIGGYRLLDILGCGGMSTVYRAEHCLLRRKVAIKVLQVEEESNPSLQHRFYVEMRALAELSHPHIVTAIDAGEVAGDEAHTRCVYLVLELVRGGDLERYVQENGPCSVTEACQFIRQAAAGLHAAHDHHIIHRDLKPSNLLLSDEGQVKLVDFGLVRHFDSRLTDPRALIGSLDYMAPEQSLDPTSVGKAADIYGLGATLFYLLTGQGPHPAEATLNASLLRLQRMPARRVSELRSDVPAVLDDLLARMLDRDPLQRPQPPLLVMHALTPFALPESAATLGLPATLPPEPEPLPIAPSAPKTRRVLLIDPVEANLVRSLHDHGFVSRTVAQFDEAEALLRQESFPLVVVQSHPDLNRASLQRLRSRSTDLHQQILVIGDPGQDWPGANVVLPFAVAEQLLPVRCELLLSMKEALERSQLLTAQYHLTTHQLQESLQARDRDVREAHNALLFAMAKMAESREGETPGHLRRLQGYCRALALAATAMSPWDALVDARFLELLDRCLPLHDIGKIGLPEDILLKPGALNDQERRLVETHPVIGDRMLEALGREHGASLEFLGTARALVRHHHERYDGTGYPDRLAGEAIPAVARLTALGDVYDALRRDRLHKRAQSHDVAVRVILNHSAGQFDPALIQAFSDCHPRFEEIFQELPD